MKNQGQGVIANFYDETPRQNLRFLMRVSDRSTPFEFNYTVIFDGDARENNDKLNLIENRAQADMSNVLQRLQSSNIDCEFMGWQCIDQHGAHLKSSNVLTIQVKDAIVPKKHDNATF
jgi:hypothetical protein